MRLLHNGNWGAKQHTYGLLLDHTHMSPAQVPEEKARVKVANSLRFLSRKLVEDLEEGAKIFVYRTITRELTEPEVEDISRALNAYGPNTLLLVRHATEENPPLHRGSAAPRSADRVHRPFRACRQKVGFQQRGLGTSPDLPVAALQADRSELRSTAKVLEILRRHSADCGDADAIRLLATLRGRAKTPQEAWSKASSILAGQGHAGLAEAFLGEALYWVPGDASLVHDLARFAERRGGLVVFLRPPRNGGEPTFCWRRARSGIAYTALMNALRRLGRHDESAQWSRICSRSGFLTSRRCSPRPPAGWRPSASGCARWKPGSPVAVRSRFPDSKVGHLGLAAVLTEAGRPNDARRALETALVRLPADTDVLSYAALAAERGADWPRAAELWRRFIVARHRIWWGYVGLARAALRSGDMAKAQAAFEEGRGVLPQEHRLIHDYVALLAGARQAEPAVAAIHRALAEPAPLPRATLVLFGETALLGGDLSCARQCAERALHALHADGPDVARLRAALRARLAEPVPASATA